MFDTSTAEGPTSHNSMDKNPPDVQLKDQCTSSSAVAPHNASHDHVTCHLPDDGRDRQQSYKPPGAPTLDSPQARDGHPDFDLTAGIAVSHMHMTTQRAHKESTGASCSIQSQARVPTTPSVLVNSLTDNDSQMAHDGTMVKNDSWTLTEAQKQLSTMIEFTDNAQLATLQRQSADLQDMIQYLENGSLPLDRNSATIVVNDSINWCLIVFNRRPVIPFV